MFSDTYYPKTRVKNEPCPLLPSYLLPAPDKQRIEGRVSFHTWSLTSSWYFESLEGGGFCRRNKRI